MLILTPYLNAARTLLTGGADVPKLGFTAGPVLDNYEFVRLACIAQESDLDVVHLAFGDDLSAGPIRAQIVFPRAGVVHVRPLGVLWAPANDGVGAIVCGRGGRGHVRYDDGELAQFPGRIAQDLQPGIRRARARLMAAVRDLAEAA